MMKRLIKFGLVSLILLIFSFISFGYCYNSLVSPVQHDLTSSNSFQSSCNGVCCFMSSTSSSTLRQAVRFNGDYQLFPSSLTLYGLSCVSYSGNFTVSTAQGSTTALKFYDLTSLFSCPTCEVCDDPYTSSECQQEYSLMPISSCDSEFCQLNNLCPVYTGDSGNTGTNWSVLFINDIEHVGAGLINITIPQEIDWDYIYTGNGDELDLDIKGYNVDSDYIEGIINIQTTKPNNIDFNNTITGLLPLFIPGLVIILFIYFIFRFLKKVF